MSPFAIAGPAVVNVSGGRTSALMLRRVLDAHGGTLPRDVFAVFANTDDDVARVIGALTREYVAGGRGADRFFRGAVTLLRTSTVQDLREVARVIDAVCEVANGRNVKVYSETDGGQEETGIGVCQDLPGELNPAGTKLPWEEPSRMIHLLRTSGIGWTRAVFSGDAWVIAPDDAHRLRQIFALLPP